MSIRTVQRELKSLNLTYKKAELELGPHHHEARIKFATDHLENPGVIKKTVFTDEKKFNRDGPDDWRSWMSERDSNLRFKRQLGGGGLMVWGMVLPTGQVYVFRLKGKCDSIKYVSLIDTKAIPVLKAHFGERLIHFQQDNAPIHTTNYTLPRLKALGLDVMK